MKNVIKDGFLIAYKDLLTFFRSPARTIVFVIMPLFMMILTGYIFPSKSSLHNTDIAVANVDQGEMGLLFTHILKDNIGFKITNATNLEEIKEMIKEGKISGGIVIPANFTYNISHQKQSQIILITDQTNPQKIFLPRLLFQILINQWETKKHPKE